MSQYPKRVKITAFLSSVYMSVCRVWKFDESDHGILIVVICRKVLVLKGSTPILGMTRN